MSPPWFVGFALALSCSEPLPAAATPAEEPTVTLDPELRLMWGGLQPRASDKDFQRSLAYVRKHPEVIPEVVVALHRDGAESRKAARLLGLLGRPEHVPDLAKVLAESEIAASAAGDALADHPAPEAKTALLAAIQAPKRSTATAAMEVVRARKWTDACPALVIETTSPDAIRRFHALRAAYELGCVSLDELRPFERDPDAEIAAYAAGHFPQ